jgi:ActR/RegA family two-component response regulator
MARPTKQTVLLPPGVKRLTGAEFTAMLKSAGIDISAFARALPMHRRTLQRKLHKGLSPLEAAGLLSIMPRIEVRP